MNALHAQEASTFDEATKYITTLEKSLGKKSKFNNDLLYGMVAMSFEKLFVSLLARFDVNATHHTPLALYQEASKITPLPLSMKETAQLLNKFESICSFDGFGYKTPTNDELTTMILGLIAIREFMKPESL